MIFTVYVASHQKMSSTDSGRDYEADMLHLYRNCHISVILNVEFNLLFFGLTGRPQLVGKWSMVLREKMWDANVTRTNEAQTRLRVPIDSPV